MGNAKTILLTGFGPFPGVSVNASADLARRLAAAGREGFPAYDFVAETLPVEWETAPRRLVQLLDETRPILALHFGVSRSANGFIIETRARNAAGVLPDARGASPAAPCLLEAGAADLASTFPAEEIVAALAAAGLPAQTSRDAGGYVCNAALYHSLRHAAGAQEGRITGFVHVPAALAAREMSGVAARSLLNWDQALAGGIVIIQACLSARIERTSSPVR